MCDVLFFVIYAEGYANGTGFVRSEGSVCERGTVKTPSDADPVLVEGRGEGLGRNAFDVEEESVALVLGGVDLCALYIEKFVSKKAEKLALVRGYCINAVDIDLSYSCGKACDAREGHCANLIPFGKDIRHFCREGEKSVASLYKGSGQRRGINCDKSRALRAKQTLVGGRAEVVNIHILHIDVVMPYCLSDIERK